MHHGLGMRAIGHGLHRAQLPLQSCGLRGPDSSPGAPVYHRCLPSSLPDHSSSTPFQKQEKDAGRTHLHNTTREMTSSTACKRECHEVQEHCGTNHHTETVHQGVRHGELWWQSVQVFHAIRGSHRHFNDGGQERDERHSEVWLS